MKKILFENIIPGVLILAIGTYIGIYANSSKEKNDNKPRFLDYNYFVNDNLVQVPENKLLKDIRISYQERSIENLTTANVSIFNFSNRDFENIPINITLKPANGDSLEIIRNNFEGINAMPEDIEFRNEIKRPDNSRIFQFNIKTANRSGRPDLFFSSNSVLKVSFLIIGSKKPNLEVSVNKAGLDVRPYLYKNYAPFSIFNILDSPLVLIFVFILYVLFIILLARFSNFFFKKSIAKKLQIRKDFLAGKLQNFNNIKDSKELVNQFYEVNDLYDWENQSHLTRFLNGKKKPKEQLIPPQPTTSSSSS
ncbi:MAG TPA: hypothetical protein VJY62_17570 [Bacteroidia bacterium]|nr:hypothetical protein [Bacteroidia bacterium]